MKAKKKPGPARPQPMIITGCTFYGGQMSEPAGQAVAAIAQALADNARALGELAKAIAQPVALLQVVNREAP